MGSMEFAALWTLDSRDCYDDILYKYLLVITTRDLRLKK